MAPIIEHKWRAVNGSKGGRWLNKILSIVSLFYLNLNLKARKLDKSTRLLFSTFKALQNGRVMIVVISIQSMACTLDMSNRMLNSRNLSKTFTTIIGTCER